jgi:predicted SprT family Zn-dependent metalloprotease
MFESINKLLKKDQGYLPLDSYEESMRKQEERERKEREQRYRESLSTFSRTNTNSQAESLEQALKALPVPESCDRCRVHPPKIRVKDKDKGTLEFICYSCKNNDNVLNRMAVKPKV